MKNGNNNAEIHPIISPPKYEQIQNFLSEQIIQGIYPVHSKLDSEDELARKFNVARGTIRQAIQRLENEGIVETIHGKGTFVRRKNSFTKTRFVSFILTEDGGFDLFSNDFYMPILTSLVKEARKNNIKILFSSFTPKEMLENEDLFFSYIGDGSFIVRKLPEPIIQKFHDYNIPFVIIGNTPDKRKENSIMADNYRGAYMATEYLIKLGHTRIVHITHDMSTQSGVKRLDGYLNALKKYNVEINENLIIRGDNKDKVEIYKKLDALIRSKTDYTAVFASSDHRAIIAMDYFKENGIRVPEQMSVIGFDNTSIASHPYYSLTTIDVNKEEFGKKAVSLMIRLLDNINHKPEVITTKVSLMKRNSCRKIT